MQFQLPFPATEPAFDITPLLEELEAMPMRCPFCGSDDVVNYTPEDYNPILTIETWFCSSCKREFDGWDHIPHPYQATLLYRCPACGTTGTEPKGCPRCARAAVEAASRRPGAGAAAASAGRRGAGGEGA